MSYTAVVEAAREGRMHIPFGAKNAEEFQEARESIINETLAMRGPERVDRLEEASERMFAVLHTVRPEDLDKRAWHRKGTTQVRYYINQRLYEIVIHTWDIGNDPEAPLPPGPLEAMTETLQERFPLCFHRMGRTEPSGRFRFEATDRDLAWGLEIQSGKAASFPDEGGPYEARLSASASDLLLLSNGRADAGARESAGRLRVEGNRDKAESLMSVLFRPY